MYHIRIYKCDILLHYIVYTTYNLNYYRNVVHN
jgi:hypothetical protein